MKTSHLLGYMRRIQVHFKPSLLFRSLQIVFVSIMFLLIYYGAKQIDTSSGEGIFLTEGILAILVTVSFVVFFLKSDVILSPQKYMTMDDEGLSIENKRRIGKKYF